MKNNIFQIIKPSTILKKNKNNHIIDSECLFGEIFNVVDIKGNWSFGTSEEDQYKGWIQSNALGFQLNSTHVVASTRSFIFAKPDMKSKVINYLPLRSKITVNKIESSWARLDFFMNKKYDYGYVLKSHILENNKVELNWVQYAEELLFTPYRWGGRDSIGVDCSALLQLSKAFNGEKLPRDTNDQFEYFNKLKKYSILNDIKHETVVRGDIVYWKGHIAIIVDNENLIHASGHHGKVVVEKIKEAIKRVNKKFFLIKENKN